MEILCRACLAKGTEMIQMDQELLNKYNSLTNLNITLPVASPLYTCLACFEAVNFCVEFIGKCIESNITLQSVKIANKIVTKSKKNNDEEQIIIKEELKVEYDDTKIVYEHLEDVSYDDDLEQETIKAAVKNEDETEIYEDATQVLQKNNQKEKKEMTKIKEVKDKKEVTKVKEGIVKKVVTTERRESTRVKSKPKIIKTGNLKTKFVPCGLCPELLESSKLTAHLEGHNPDVPCGLCPQQFIGRAHLYSHRTQHLPESLRKCHLCPRKAWSEVQLEFHYMRAHDLAEKDAPIQCKLCQKKYATLRLIQRHLLSHTENNKFECKICKKCFSSKHALETHRWRHAKEPQYKKCDLCDFSTMNPGGVELHKLRRHTEGRVYCNRCRKPFQNKQKLEEHMVRTCRGKPSYVCTVCGYVQDERKKFYAHMRRHSDKCMYKCEQCNSTFKTSTNYRTHLDRHAGKPRHACEFCQRAFYAYNVLVKHRRTHTGEKPYVCKVCSKGFTANHNLKVHMRIHGVFNLIKTKDKEVDNK